MSLLDPKNDITFESAVNAPPEKKSDDKVAELFYNFLSSNDSQTQIVKSLNSAELYDLWLALKRAEINFYAQRTQTVETEILARLNIDTSIPAQASSSKTHRAGSYKIKVTRNVAYKVEDVPQLELLFSNNPDATKPYTLKPTVSVSSLENLRIENHALYRQAARLISHKENKPTIVIEKEGESE